jgi:hypothetical protein
MHSTCIIDHELSRRAETQKIIEAKKVLPRDASRRRRTTDLVSASARDMIGHGE